MTTAEAIKAVRQAGGEFLVPAPGRLQAYVPSPHPSELETALENIREHRDEALTLLFASDRPPEKLPPTVKGQAVCLYSDLVGEHLWLAADEADAEALLTQGECRGRIYTPEEVKLVVRIADPEIVKQMHEFKQKFNTRMLPPDHGK